VTENEGFGPLLFSTMLKPFALIASAAMITGAATVPVPDATFANKLEDILNEMELENTEPTKPITTEVKADKAPVWVCKSCGSAEQTTLAFLQEEAGITDRAALATILGNIQQESRFTPNICEGGARVSYHRCYNGGYGLIQWTTYGRYHGLGHHASITGGNPSSLKTQLSYLVTEREWKMALKRFQTPGQSIDYYMKGAYTWLGWGIHGNRTAYANQYYAQLSQG